MTTSTADQASGTFTLGGDLTVNRLGFGAMRITGKGIWGPPDDHDECIRVLRRAVELGVNFIDTANSYGPYVSEELIREALHPYGRPSSSRPRRVCCAPARMTGCRLAFRAICAKRSR